MTNINPINDISLGAITSPTYEGLGPVARGILWGSVPDAADFDISLFGVQRNSTTGTWLASGRATRRKEDG